MKPAIYAAVLAAAATPLIVSQMKPKPAVTPPPAQSGRIPQFENPAAKVWKTSILPNQPLAMHHHDHPRIIVALTTGDINFVDSGGATEHQHWDAGHAYWLPAMPPNTLHSDVNAGQQPIEVMVIEMEKEQ